MKDTDWWHYQMTRDTKGTWGAKNWRQMLVEMALQINDTCKWHSHYMMWCWICYFKYDVLMNFLLHLMFRRKWKGVGMAYFKMLIQHLSTATDRNYKKPPSGWLVSELLFKDRTTSMYYWGTPTPWRANDDDDDGGGGDDDDDNDNNSDGQLKILTAIIIILTDP